MRKLASIQVVNQIEPIPGADAIERLRILGWWVVGKKGEFRAGDRVVYCEIDSLLPERPEFEFLRKSCFKPEVRDAHNRMVRRAGFRIKTVKLRGQVSQGICFPLSLLPPGTPTAEGADVTELLDVHQYEPPWPISLSGRIKGAFPGFLSKTDELRVQVVEPFLTRHRGKTFYLTEKLDGASFTAFLRQGEFGICSRNLWLDESDETNLLAQLARELDLRGKLAAIRARHGFDPALQAEVLGPGIQGNKYGLDRAYLRVFNVINVDTTRLVDHHQSLQLLAEVGLEAVPQLGTLVLEHTVDQLVALAQGTSVLNSKALREGIVLRPLREEQDPDFGWRLSFKVINPGFLLRYDE